MDMINTAGTLIAGYTAGVFALSGLALIICITVAFVRSAYQAATGQLPTTDDLADRYQAAKAAERRSRRNRTSHRARW